MDPDENYFHIAGSLAYCAPEVLEGKLRGNDPFNYSTKQDIWSIASVVHECVTGKLPGGFLMQVNRHTWYCFVTCVLIELKRIN